MDPSCWRSVRAISRVNPAVPDGMWVHPFAVQGLFPPGICPFCTGRGGTQSPLPADQLCLNQSIGSGAIRKGELCSRVITPSRWAPAPCSLRTHVSAVRLKYCHHKNIHRDATQRLFQSEFWRQCVNLSWCYFLVWIFLLGFVCSFCFLFFYYFKYVIDNFHYPFKTWSA